MKKMILTNVSNRLLMIDQGSKELIKIDIGDTFDVSNLKEGVGHYYVEHGMLAQSDVQKTANQYQELEEKDKEIAELKAKLANANKRKTRRKTKDSGDEEAQETESETGEQVDE